MKSRTKHEAVVEQDVSGGQDIADDSSIQSRLVSAVFDRLVVAFMFGVTGFVLGGILGLPFGPMIAISAPMGGALGFFIGGVWEYRRLVNEDDYEDYLN